MTPSITLKIIDREGAGAHSTFLALARQEGASIADVHLGSGPTKQAAFQEALNGYFKAQREAFSFVFKPNVASETPGKPASPDLDVLKPYSGEVSITFPSVEFKSGPILSKRVAVDKSGVRRLLREALHEQALLDVEYVKADGSRTQRRVRVSTIGTTHVSVRDQDREGAFRSFIIDRIERAEVIG